MIVFYVYMVLCSIILFLVKAIEASTNAVLCWDAYMLRKINGDFVKRVYFYCQISEKLDLIFRQDQSTLLRHNSCSLEKEFGAVV